MRRSESDRANRAGELSEDLRTQVAVGRSAYSWLVEDAMERWANEVEDDQLLESTIREVATQELARHLAEQTAWPQLPECRRSHPSVPVGERLTTLGGVS
ncbi:DUF6891 domain-containing protein [Nonomuraea cavernae]|uniref:DUF6891 domain-containing protein n=1 Tax=Nonomuraea cavernae TaxID=2045107 RepID=UPI003558D758